MYVSRSGRMETAAAFVLIPGKREREEVSSRRPRGRSTREAEGGSVTARSEALRTSWTARSRPIPPRLWSRAPGGGP